MSTASRHTLSFLTDETGPDHAAALRFAVAQGLTTVDIRSIGGVNFLSLDADRQQAVACAVRDAGLTVGCLATPLLKWPAEGRGAATMGDQFGFDAKGRSTAELYRDAFDAAERLGTRRLRIFTLLAYEGFQPLDLARDFEQLLALAEERDCTLHVENEHVCNVGTIADLAAIGEAFPHPRLRLLLDIPNARYGGQLAVEADLPRVVPRVDLVHFKDFSDRDRRFVALGEGDVPFETLWPLTESLAGGRALTLTIETHVPDEQPGATERSLAHLRRLVGCGA
jgi:L-ribulose-5-phosphate 3-epimerase